jgi:hypothetical protein
MRREYVDERGDGLEGKGFGDVRKGRKLYGQLVDTRGMEKHLPDMQRPQATAFDPSTTFSQPPQTPQTPPLVPLRPASAVPAHP